MATYPKLWVVLEDEQGKTTNIDIPNPKTPPVKADVHEFGTDLAQYAGSDYLEFGYVGEATITANGK